jgi:putative ABC transport system substrate-binding protein
MRSPSRALPALVALGFLAGALTVAAQSPAKVARLGYLSGKSEAVDAPWLRSLREGLNELGYVEGRNLLIEYRWAEGDFDRLPALAAELVRLPVDLILADGDPVIAAASRATGTIPIVMTAVGDPVARGFAASLARPGGNITGVSNLAVELTGKWLEILKECVPGLAQAAILGNATNPTHRLFWEEAERAARALRVKLKSVEVRSAGDLEEAFASMRRERSGAVVVLPDPLFIGQSRRVAELAASSRLPAMYTFREQAEAGGLASYGPSLRGNFRRAATYVDRILKGARPGDLPIQQPTTFELVVNLKTAKALGLTVPPALLLQTNHVIE